MSKGAQEEEGLVRLDPQALIRAAIESGAGIETLERLVALAKDVRAQQAKEAWYHAMAEFQRLCPPVIKSAVAKIPTKSGGSYSYKYAPLDEITSAIRPIMGELGLSIAWLAAKMTSAEVSVICRVSHELGHFEESGEITMPIQKYEGTGASEPQRSAIAMTYAQRYSLRAITGLVPEDDRDAEDHQEKGTVVEMPKRKSETVASAPAQTREGLVWFGALTDIDEKKSSKGAKFWVATGNDEDGKGRTTFSTFSSTIMTELVKFLGTGDQMEITYTWKESGGKSYNNIDAVRALEAS